MHGEVQNGVKRTLVLSGSSNVGREDLAHAENASTSAEVGPEASLDVFGSINAETINVILGYKVFDPGLIGLDDGRVISVEIGKRDLVVAHPAVLLGLVITPLDGTIRMIQGRVLEHVLGVIWRHGGRHNVIDNDVNHDIPTK